LLEPGDSQVAAVGFLHAGLEASVGPVKQLAVIVDSVAGAEVVMSNAVDGDAAEDKKLACQRVEVDSWAAAAGGAKASSCLEATTQNIGVPAKVGVVNLPLIGFRFPAAGTDTAEDKHFDSVRIKKLQSQKDRLIKELDLVEEKFESQDRLYRKYFPEIIDRVAAGDTDFSKACSQLSMALKATGFKYFNEKVMHLVHFFCFLKCQNPARKISTTLDKTGDASIVLYLN